MRRIPMGGPSLQQAGTEGGPDPAQARPRLWKYIGTRIVVRVLAVGAFLGTMHFLGVDLNAIITSYTAWVDEVAATDLAGAIAIFWLGSVAFNTISPTGYLPTLLAGATFRWYIAWPVSYTQVNAAAALNMLLVRACGMDNAVNRWMQGKMTQWEWLNSELRRRKQASRVVMLIRLPYVWNGMFNYVFSLSNISARDYMLGNAVGFIPGSFLFSRLGAQARSLLKLVASGRVDGADIVMLVLEVLFLVISIGALAWYFKRLWVRREREAEVLSCVSESAALLDSDPLEDADFVDDYFSHEIRSKDGDATFAIDASEIGTGGLSGAY